MVEAAAVYSSSGRTRAHAPRVSRREWYLVLERVKERLGGLASRAGVAGVTKRSVMGAAMVALVLAGWAGYRWLAPVRSVEPQSASTLESADASSSPDELRAEAASSTPSSSAETTVPPNAFVHIVGAVVHPGVYEVAGDARVGDVVVLAGGFTGNAAQASVNLARLVADGEQVVVLTTDEVASAAVPPSTAQARASAPPPSTAVVQPAAPSGGSGASVLPPPVVSSPARPGSVARRPRQRQLRRHDGVGDATRDRSRDSCRDHRRARTERSVRDGGRSDPGVTGIGEKKLAAIRDLVCV